MGLSLGDDMGKDDGNTLSKDTSKLHSLSLTKNTKERRRERAQIPTYH